MLLTTQSKFCFEAFLYLCHYSLPPPSQMPPPALWMEGWYRRYRAESVSQSPGFICFQSFIECPSLSKCSGHTKVNNNSSCFLSKNGERQEREKPLYAVHTVVTHQGSGIRKQEFKLKLRCFSCLILGKPGNDPELVISPVKWFLPLMILTSWCCCGYKIVCMEVYYCKWVTVQQCLQSCGAVFL